MAAGPKYQRIVDDLRARIDAGEYAPGTRLPTKDELKARYSVAINTVERALGILRDAGYVESVQGSGIWALTPPGRQPSEFDVVMKRMDEFEAAFRLLESRVTAAEQAREEPR
jgi:DNA-binding GntR family transcriptional regulator